MLESIFITLVILTITLFFLSIVWESLALSAVDIGLWFILALGVMKIETPYSHITTGNTVVTGTIVNYDLSPLAYIFMLIGVIMFIYVLVEHILPILKQKFTRMM